MTVMMLFLVLCALVLIAIALVYKTKAVGDKIPILQSIVIIQYTNSGIHYIHNALTYCGECKDTYSELGKFMLEKYAMHYDSCPNDLVCCLVITIKNKEVSSCDFITHDAIIPMNDRAIFGIEKIMCDCLTEESREEFKEISIIFNYVCKEI